MIIYIAGKIEGDPNYKKKFMEAEEELKARGHIVLNPAKLPQGMSKEKYMPICLAMLSQADIVLLLSDYEESPGALLELNYALYQDKQIIKYDFFLRRAEDEN